MSADDICAAIGQRIVWHEGNGVHEGVVCAYWGHPKQLLIRKDDGTTVTLVASKLQVGNTTIVSSVDIPLAVEIAKGVLANSHMCLPLNQIVNELAKAVVAMAEPRQGKEAA